MISVIIPTLNAQKYIEKLIDKLKAQKLEQELEIIVIDSASDDKTVQIARDAGARVLEINRAEFDHGGTRNLGWRSAKGEIICFMTQDALPVDDLYLTNLIQGFEDNDVVMISGRQVPKSDANYVERLTRAFNYPAISIVRSQKDIESMGIKAYFFSDVCAAYRRSFLEETGGFDSPIISNEDMLLAAKALQAGYRVRYEAKAEVYHSHNFSLRYQYCRNFDVAVFMEMYKDIVKGDGTTGEGIRMVLYTEKELFLHLHFVSMFRCVFESAAKFLGNRAGRRYRSLSKEKIMKRTSNPVFWKSNDIFNH
ncbi:MAG: glycosyltransferase [Agathobacter sp.]|nr:glycosyltransferase [Agathobacter sp.]